ncbi:MAG: acetyl-CoA carboxylase carboxyl transferase subunit alpha, partial [Gammaproteobacteria bacterium]|nr:acetyl-CoA carboxylase carboxyl transferase subunit alpha [Gammaproteobacteria bacterium]
MDPNFLDFEQPIAELQAKISELRYVTDDSEINISEEIATLEKKAENLTATIFSRLSSWQISQLSRHPNRPYALDYIDRIFTDFEHLHGDRVHSNDHPIIGGIGRLNGKPVMVIGQQKGRDTKEKIKRNFGMARPEGYRKALR